MIKANELRMGNIVFELEPVIVDSIHEHGINRDMLGAVIPFDMLAGIPLTPELLEKSGGIKHPDNNGTDIYWFKKDFAIRWLNYSEPIIHILGYDRRHQNIQYLHQLQNLYFALTGQELEVSL